MKDLVPKILGKEEEEEEDGYDGDEQLKQKEIEETMQETIAEHEKIVHVRLNAAQARGMPRQLLDSKYVKYKPSQQSAGMEERLIRLVEMPVDRVEPPKFKHKQVPKVARSPPVPVMRSPPQLVTLKDRQDWKTPPCTSNGKNAKGYVIPLKQRLVADGRGLQVVEINKNFAKLSEALYCLEQKAREAVAMRLKLQKEILMKDKERREQELRALAQKALFEREKDKDMLEEMREMREERLQREEIREERRGARERKRRLETRDGAVGKKRKITKGSEGDINEKIALGKAFTGGLNVMYDQRLFNQTNRLDSGFGSDDQYNVHDRKLLNVQPMLSTLYWPTKDEEADLDPFGLEQLMKEVKKEK